MLDIRLIRDQKDFVIKELNKRGGNFKDVITELFSKDTERRKFLGIVESSKNTLNVLSKKVGLLKREGKDAEAKEWMDGSKELSEEISKTEKLLKEFETKIQEDMSSIPNILLSDVPVGKSSDDNKIIKLVGEPRKFDFEPKDHVDLGEKLGLLDFERAAKIAGGRFAMLTGNGAKLERALINFMLDENTKNGYKEIVPPFLANSQSLFGTGQLPKFEEDLFKCKDDEYYLIPTAEVPLTNIHRGEFVNEIDLPIKYTAYTPCFRREAGSYGKDTRGLIRNHQFNKIEIVKLVKPENSEKELDLLLADACRILDLLELPYRIVLLCSGDTGFGSAKTFDIEVWMPSANAYREISSCSLFTDFQARRLNIKYKDNNKNTKLVHTLNGSSLAVGRTFASILENYQDEDGNVKVPNVLKQFFNEKEFI